MKTKKDVLVPENLAKALMVNEQALISFESMPVSHQRRYIEWIGEAKKSETINRRIQHSVDMIINWGKENNKI